MSGDSPTICLHLIQTLDTVGNDIKKFSCIEHCEQCSSKSNLWLCLHGGCYFVGCGEDAKDHSDKHYQSTEHTLAMNLTSQRAWCYICYKEVFLHDRQAALKHKALLNAEANIQTIDSAASMSHTSTEGTLDADDMDVDEDPRGLTGLRNLGNTCYLNAAVQALSNCVPLTQFFLECKGYVPSRTVASIYMNLISEMWLQKRPYIAPMRFVEAIQQVHPMFKGYSQQDTQEFLRFFMDQVHEELKQPIVYHDSDDESSEESTTDCCEPPAASPQRLQESTEFETCDSGVSSERGSNDPPDQQHSDSLLHSDLNDENSSRDMDGSTSPSKLSYNKSFNKAEVKKEKKEVEFRSVISDIFDGKLLSSVQCLTCERISTCRETFQDLSLPIPGKEHLPLLHQKPPSASGKGGACTELPVPHNQGWMYRMWGWLSSWFWGPVVTLQDCLAAFFSADELKDDNMYSCEKCKKLRNGVKFNRMLVLPEVLCIHLKRFRHDFMFSSKISQPVSFPLEGLDMRPYLHPECKSEVSTYDLTGVICHRGTAGGGHYIAYAFNHQSQQWYEFDDQEVTKVMPYQVQSSEAYVLFYSKTYENCIKTRQHALKLRTAKSSLLKFYVSRQWVNRFNNFTEPGPVSNSDFLCLHGGIPPYKEDLIDSLCIAVPQALWEFFHKKYGSDMVCTHLHKCETCHAQLAALKRRQQIEHDTFVKMNREFQSESYKGKLYNISLSWLKTWEQFVNKATYDVPGPINNHSDGSRCGSAHVSEAMWRYLVGIYGGGPELVQQRKRRVTARSADDDEQTDSIPAVHSPRISPTTADTPRNSPAGNTNPRGTPVNSPLPRPVSAPQTANNTPNVMSEPQAPTEQHTADSQDLSTSHDTVKPDSEPVQGQRSCEKKIDDSSSDTSRVNTTNQTPSDDVMEE